MEPYDIPVAITNDLDRKIADTFLIFDHHSNKSVDVREIGTILRFLGCAPTEQEINEVISATEFDDSSGTIHLSKFLPHVSALLNERKMEPAAPEKLFEAFRVLDPDNKGYISKDTMSKFMMEEGEPFTQEELDEMLATAVDTQTGNIPYEYYLNSLMYKPKNSIYDLAAAIQAEKIAAEKLLSPSPKRLSEVMKRF